MERESFESLYKSKNGTSSWYSTLSGEPKEWLDALVEFVEDAGSEPVWKRVHARFKELFPEEAPDATSTITDTVRRLRG